MPHGPRCGCARTVTQVLRKCYASVTRTPRKMNASYTRATSCWHAQAPSLLHRCCMSVTQVSHGPRCRYAGTPPGAPPSVTQ
eukprot:1188875-Prorocentrum_minimum.AAC.1